MSIILDTLVGENYEPSEEELIEYGKWLGMKFPDDNSFLWIAREGLKAPLPEGWKACRSEKGDLYYFNFKTGDSMWDHPLDNQFKELLQKEKENPSLKSLANGAKKLPSKSENVEEDITATEQIKYNTTLFERKSKIGALRSLKLKKLSPDGLSSESTEESKPCLDIKNDIDALKSNKVLRASSHSILKPITNTLLTKGNGEHLSVEKNSYEVKLNGDLKNFQSEKLKEHQIEKEEYEMKLKYSWDRYQKRQKDEYDRKYNQLKDEYEKKLLDEKKKVEEEHAARLKAFSNGIEAEYVAETTRLRQVFAEKLEKEKLDTEQMHRIELENFKKNRKEEMENLCASENQLLESMKTSTKELAENSSLFLKAYKNAHDEFIDVLVNTNTTHMNVCKMTLVHLIDCAKNTYDNEIKNLKDSFWSEINQLRHRFTTEMCTLQKEHSPLINNQNRSEMESYRLLNKQNAKENGERTSNFTPCLTQGEVSNYENVDLAKEIKNRPLSSVSEANTKGVQCIDTLSGTRLEKGLLESAVTIVKEAHKNELEDVKKDLRRSVEEELKAVLKEVLRGQHNVLSALSSDKIDEAPSFQRLREGVSFHPSTGERQSEREKLSNNLLDTFQRQDLTMALTEALRAVFAGSSSTLPSTCGSSSVALRPQAAVLTGGKPFCNMETITTPSATETPTVDLEKQVDVFPVSFKDQKLLLADERQQVEYIKKFVEGQRLSLEERRHQFKVAKHQWKQDVITAKLEGVRTSSKRGQLLNKLRTILDNQAKALENDEAILRDSEKWLFMKEQNAQKMEQHIRELDEGKGGDMSFNSIDTGHLVTGFFGPTASSAPGLKVENQDIMQGNTYKENLGLIYTKTLERIARRLEEVKSLMNNQHQKRGFFIYRDGSSRHRLGQKATKGTEYIITEN